MPAPFPLPPAKPVVTPTAKGKETDAAGWYLSVLVLLEDLGRSLYVRMCIFLSGAPEPAREGVPPSPLGTGSGRSCYLRLDLANPPASKV